MDRAVVRVADHPSVDAAEGDAAARRSGDPTLICWAEPIGGGATPPAADVPGWRPRVDPDTRLVAFAVEDAIAALCAAPGLGLTGPDLLDVKLLCLLGDASWRCIREYRTLMAAVWTDLERCPHTDAHEADAAAAMQACEAAQAAAEAQPLAWRHLQLGDGHVHERSQHAGFRNPAASVAVARAVDGIGVHWCAPGDD